MTRHRVLIVGTGSIGERHVRCFQATGRAEVLICETNEALRDAVAKRYSLQQAHARLDSVSPDSYEAAVICTPAHLHIAMATQLIAGGKHVLIEKPLSVSLDGVEALCEQATNVTAGVAYVMRQHPTLQAVRQELASGRFGQPVQLVFAGGQHFPFYRPAYRDIYYADRHKGGGAIQDALTHVVNAGEWLVGPITAVAADAAHQVLPGVDVEDTVQVIARHAQVLASYSLNQHQAVNDSSFTIACREGVIRALPLQNKWLWQTEPDRDWQSESLGPINRDDLFVSQANQFLDAIERRGNFACCLSAAAQTLRVNLAVLEAAQQRRWIEL